MAASDIYAGLLLLIAISCIIGTGCFKHPHSADSIGTLERTPVTCDCDYRAGGCTISTPAPNEWKCKCFYNGAWTCSGKAIQCVNGQSCPENCTARECCITGGGNCGGY